MFSIVRQIINIGYLVGVYFVSSIVSVDLKYLLIGAALGITIPMFYFTNKLLKITNKTEENIKKHRRIVWEKNLKLFLVFWYFRCNGRSYSYVVYLLFVAIVSFLASRRLKKNLAYSKTY